MGSWKEQALRCLPGTSHSLCANLTPETLVPPPGSILSPGQRPGTQVPPHPLSQVSSLLRERLSQTLIRSPGPGSAPALTDVPSLTSLFRDLCPSCTRCVFPSERPSLLGMIWSPSRLLAPQRAGSRTITATAVPPALASSRPSTHSGSLSQRQPPADLRQQPGAG